MIVCYSTHKKWNIFPACKLLPAAASVPISMLAVYPFLKHACTNMYIFYFKNIFWRKSRKTCLPVWPILILLYIKAKNYKIKLPIKDLINMFWCFVLNFFLYRKYSLNQHCPGQRTVRKFYELQYINNIFMNHPQE